MLLAARGRSNARIAVEARLHVDTVRTWRDRFDVGRLPALADHKRSGRPSRFTPVNQVEIYLSVVQRKAVSPNDFPDLAQVGERIRAFEDRYNTAAQPFQCKFLLVDGRRASWSPVGATVREDECGRCLEAYRRL
ncbi:helix-turn-helix domain-containing protein [Streptomyces sp. SAS_270]|uniref:helix-turn-helix domain-containing protein n=1 Tax=Streptomyces sp. SAS_270 TaxID=3412748 RepID=UPI00403C24E5